MSNDTPSVVQYVLSSLKRAAENAYSWSLTPNEAGVLVAEVEWLRAEVSYLRACVPPVHPGDYGHETWTEALRAAVAEERAAGVAWLDAREEALTAEANAAQTEGRRTWAFTRASEAAYAALVIERGEHHRTPAEKEKP